MDRSTVTACALALFAGTLTPIAAAGAAEELPLRSVTLYRSGVGSFERYAEVEGDAELDLSFDAELINDVLKSLVVIDAAGDAPPTVAYEADEPLARRLEALGLDPTKASSMEGLLALLRGASVTLEGDTGTHHGTVLGVAERRVDNDTGGFASHPFVTLLTDGGVRSIDIWELRALNIDDPRLANDLAEGLAAIAGDRTEDTRGVTVRVGGEKERRVHVGYVHEAPVWKTSYRLVLPESGGAPLLQAWAIVENTTDEDWEDVTLSLAAGRPVGFSMDLYSPLFKPRMTMAVPGAGAAAARVYAGERAQMKLDRDGAASMEMRARRNELAGRAMAQAEMQEQFAGSFADDAMAPAANMAVDIAGGIAGMSTASATQAGEQFFYTVSAPVTVDRRSSAMLPIVSTALDGRRISVYTPWLGGVHPMKTAEIENDTGVPLLAGPVTVYDGDAYGGDALIATLADGKKSMLAYAVDLDVVVRPEPSSQTDHVTNIRIVDGVIERASILRQATDFEFASSTDDERTVILEQRELGGDWELVENGLEMTKADDGTLRFEIELGPRAEEEVEIAWTRTAHSTFAIGPTTLEDVLVWHKNGKASAAVVDAVRAASKLQAAVVDATNRIQTLETERDSLVRDQSRIRDNLRTVSRGSDLHDRYMRRLAEQEDRFEEIVASIEDEIAARAEAEKALKAYLRDLRVE